MNMNQIPEGYMPNARGGLDPIDLVSEIDKLRDTVVRDIAAKAQVLQDQMVNFKKNVFDDIDAFVQLSAEKYGAQIGGVKGNITLTTYDGKYRVVIANQERLSFDERIDIAKELVDGCVRKWMGALQSTTAGIEINYIAALVDDAFRVDQKGRINRNSLLRLTKLKIEDGDWKQAMQAIVDSQSVIGSKLYLRVFERIGNSDRWNPIALDLAAL